MKSQLLALINQQFGTTIDNEDIINACIAANPRPSDSLLAEMNKGELFFDEVLLRFMHIDGIKLVFGDGGASIGIPKEPLSDSGLIAHTQRIILEYVTTICGFMVFSKEI